MTSRTNTRMFVLLFLLIIIGGIFVIRLYNVQVIQADETVNATSNYEFYSTVAAARGNILDRNGKLLVSNRASYNLTINNYIIYSPESTNQNILTLIEKCESLGIEWTDNLPISKTLPFTMTLTSLSDGWQRRYKTFMTERDWDVDVTAASLMKLLRKIYSIPSDWDDETARKVVAVRYELEMRSYDYSLSTYVLCYDISSDALAALSEMNIPGVSVETGTVREYNTHYAAHILGTVGKMTAEEYEYYSTLEDQEYSMDDEVGKDGFEYAYEKYLHGTDGYKCMVVSSSGELISNDYITVPQSGGNVETTIDIDLQVVAEDALADHIETLREKGISTTTESNGAGMDAEGGAVVVISCKTGEVLACASYPTYDPSTFSEDFDELLEQEYNPLYNRALQAIYNPGSTYKPVTAICTVDYLEISPYAEFEDEGVFTEYQASGFLPQCMLYKNYRLTHEMIDLTDALCVSCNYYFYQMSDWIYKKSGGTFAPIDNVAKAMGLGEYTGVELPESKGYRANAETKAMLYSDESDQGFYAADAVLAGIGQSENKFTVMQLATYAATLANRGTRYRSTFLRRVVSSDYTEIYEQSSPEIVSELIASDLAWEAVYTGMRRVASDAQNGTARETFKDYSIAVCAKTGTAETDTGGSSNAAFICFAPADDPEIAIAIYVEKGAAGSKLAPIARTILDAYFGVNSTSSEYVLEEGTPQ